MFISSGVIFGEMWFCDWVESCFDVCILNKMMLFVVINVIGFELGCLFQCVGVVELLSFGCYVVLEVVGIFCYVYCMSFIGEYFYEFYFFVVDVCCFWCMLFVFGDDFGICLYGFEMLMVLCFEKGYIIVGQDIDYDLMLCCIEYEWVRKFMSCDFVGWQVVLCIDCVFFDCQFVGLQFDVLVFEEGVVIWSWVEFGDELMVDYFGYVILLVDLFVFGYVVCFGWVELQGGEFFDEVFIGGCVV